MASVLWPVGPGGQGAALGATGTQAVTINDNLFVIDGVTTQATGNRTINLTIDSKVKVGAILVVRTKTAGTETTTYGTGLSAPVLTGVVGRTFSQAFIYTGTVFTAAGTAVQVD
jgi:hypothetical protein